MTDQVDHVHVNIDAPIPYTLTARGRRECAELRLAEVQDFCEHDWQVNLRIGLVCRRCGAEASVRRQSIPAYLGPRDR